LHLALYAALSAGAGRVYASALAAEGQAAQALRPELMSQPWGYAQWWKAPPAVLGARQAGVVTLCGCGGGPEVAGTLPALLAHVPRLVLDADALNAIAADAALWQRLAARHHHGGWTVLTPHPLEAARLLGTTTAEVQGDRLHAASALAQCTGTVVVLKGSGTVVARPGAAPFVNPTGNARLATAGSGDVLAGWIAGAWARSHSAAHEDRASLQALAAACVWLHGHAAETPATSPRWPLLAADLVHAMARWPG
jgi:ADP-dependent NAD(P)H-hydrate dehydratase / NAD(P)H-hydrate epimerase